MRAQHHLTPTWLALTGPTACGKSGVAMRLAQDLPLEIVSVDSALVYRGMDIGTAKPTAADRAAVPHHLIDIIDPSESCSAASFVNDASALVRAITARGRVPLLVGGTMLYLRAWLHGLDDMPQANAQVRANLDAQAAQHGWPALHAELARVDPGTAARLSPNDSQRIQRALEVWRVSGRPLSAWHTPRDASQPDLAQRVISLEPASRAWLHARIAERFDAMLAHGLIDEVRSLMARPDLGPQMPSMRCVGYRQTWEALAAGDMAGLRERGIAATRQLAKRQVTWLRSTAGRQTVACDADPDVVYRDVLQRMKRLIEA